MTLPSDFGDPARLTPDEVREMYPALTMRTVRTWGLPSEASAPSPLLKALQQTTAQRGTATVGERVVGSTVAGMIPNDEQEAILAAAGQDGLKVLVVGAGAGTGKTATLKMLEQVLQGIGQYTAFNRSLVDESKGKFTKAACHSTHQLAYRAVGHRYKHRLGGERVRSGRIAHLLGIESMSVLVPGNAGPDGEPRGKTLSAEFLAGQVLVAIRRFCQSADREIDAKHLRYIDGIDGSVEMEDVRTVRGWENNDRVREYLLPFCKAAWEDMAKLDGTLPFTHDAYVKLWQLGTGSDRPVIAADYILLDEAQDTAPVFLDILQQQTHALLVLVGDDNQQIYEWRGACNAMATFPDAPRCLLSQSYRFGQAIADVANSVLDTLDKPTDLVMRGMPGIPSRVAVVAEPRCYLYRTNAGAISRVMRDIEEGKTVHLIGGGEDTVKFCQAAIDLQAKRGTRHPELCCFESWPEVVEYSRTDEGDDLNLMVRLIEEFGAEDIKEALDDMPSEEDADLVVSTAHKSKGREWDTVKLGQDFPTANKMGDSDRRLLYVAATRAKLTLDISVCPSFCGGEDTAWGEGGLVSVWVPGLKLTYTGTMPTAEEQQEWVEEKARGSKPQTAETVRPVAQLKTAPVAAVATGFTWYNDGGKWCARGPGGVEIGGRVEVKRRDGSASLVTVKKVVRKFPDNWIYEV